MVKVAPHVLTPTGAIRAWATILMLILGFGAALGLTIAFVAKTRAQEDRQWCDLLVILDAPVPPPSGTTVPLTERAQRINRAIHQLRLEKHCAR